MKNIISSKLVNKIKQTTIQIQAEESAGSPTRIQEAAEEIAEAEPDTKASQKEIALDPNDSQGHINSYGNLNLKQHVKASCGVAIKEGSIVVQQGPSFYEKLASETTSLNKRYTLTEYRQKVKNSKVADQFAHKVPASNLFDATTIHTDKDISQFDMNLGETLVQQDFKELKSGSPSRVGSKLPSTRRRNISLANIRVHSRDGARSLVKSTNERAGTILRKKKDSVYSFQGPREDTSVWEGPAFEIRKPVQNQK